jgi:hypothetical protein
MSTKELIQIENISVEELTEIIAEKLVDKLEKKIATLISNQNNDELLSRAETAILLKTSYVSLWNWTKTGKLSAYRMGNKVYYKKGEIFKALGSLNK